MPKLALTFPTFRQAPAVVFGRGSLRSLAAADDGATVFLTSSAPSVTGYLSDVLARKDGGLHAGNTFTKPAGEPTEAAIGEAAQFIAKSAPRRIVAVGGGSVLDWARLSWAAAAGLIATPQAVDEPISAEIRFSLVPTTCGTGAEAADVAVYARHTGAKVAVVNRALMADQVILDSRFLDDLDVAQLAAFSCDALSHALEAQLSLIPGALPRASARNALDMILASFSQTAPDCDKDRLLEASFLAGVAAANCSVGIVHAFAHTIGADGVPHGIANAIGLRTGLLFNAATAQMTALLATRPEPELDDLLARLDAVIAPALRDVTGLPAVARLADGAYRADIATRMAKDVAIRSNPRRPNDAERLKFVDDVAKTLHLL